MIIYGRKSKLLDKDTIADKCPNCGESNSLTLYAFQDYAHVFWIPFFPTEKRYFSQCNNCKQVLKTKEMPSFFRPYFENLKSRVKTPIWIFSGLALVVVLIAYGVVSEQMTHSKTGKFVMAPQAGDIFEIKTKDNHYTLWEIAQIQGDSAFVKMYNYETNQETGIDDLKDKKDGAYSTDLYGVSKIDLRQMFDKGDILNIERK